MTQKTQNYIMLFKRPIEPGRGDSRFRLLGGPTQRCKYRKAGSCDRQKGGGGLASPLAPGNHGKGCKDRKAGSCERQKGGGV